MKGLILIFSLLICLIIQPLAQAVLIENADGITVTQVRNDGSALMWVKDANLAKSVYPGTPPFNGLMQYEDALAWIAHLNSISYAGYSDWRLPLTNPEEPNGSTDCGYYFPEPDSEMGYMYYTELGNVGYCDADGYNCPQPGWDLNTHGEPKIQNLQDGIYWSEELNFQHAWYFRLDTGEQCYRPKIYLSYAWAVRNTGLPPIRPGDINRDYTITIEDAIIGMQILSGLASSIQAVTDEVDVDGDDAIGFAEILYVLQKVSISR